MVDASTFGVLHDLSIFVSIATALSLAGYYMMRHLRPEVSWNQEGQVLSRPYGAADLLVLAVMGLAYILTMQPREADAGNVTSESGVIVSMAFQLIVCVGLLLYLFQIRGLNLAELFGLEHLPWRSLLRTVAVFTVIILVSVNLLSALSTDWLRDIWPNVQPQDMVKAFKGSSGIGYKILVIIAAVVIAPLAEETLFRGFVYGVLKRYTDAPFAALSSSLMFAIIHMHVGALLPLCALAVLFCVAYELTGCLLVPMLLHAIFNGVSITWMMFGES
ncbi:type II CAAX prenyl endopeptidase Rce1 family protein [Prosthecobacter sp.]|uniref:CPBP family glutamic-type intramembrane protease n=1 Tax=Prosthecobacter sp. TaxID=1965333 RepID=UPI00378365A9